MALGLVPLPTGTILTQEAAWDRIKNGFSSIAVADHLWCCLALARRGALTAGEMMLMEFDRIDHVVFTVRDIAATCDFYARALGLRVLTFDEGRRALQVGQCQINLHQQGHEFEPKALHPGPGTQDICLVTTAPLHEVIGHLRNAGIAIIAGPVPRTGARGTMESVYVRDPDGNLVEVARYPEGGG